MNSRANLIASSKPSQRTLFLMTLLLLGMLPSVDLAAASTPARWRGATLAGLAFLLPLTDEELPAGAHSVRWDAEAGSGVVVAPGLYHVRLQTPAGVQTTKILRVQ